MSTDYSIQGKTLTMAHIQESIKNGELVTNMEIYDHIEQFRVRVSSSDEVGSWVWLSVNDDNEVNHLTTYSGNTGYGFDMWLRERDSFLVFES